MVLQTSKSLAEMTTDSKEPIEHQSELSCTSLDGRQEALRKSSLNPTSKGLCGPSCLEIKYSQTTDSNNECSNKPDSNEVCKENDPYHFTEPLNCNRLCSNEAATLSVMDTNKGDDSAVDGFLKEYLLKQGQSGSDVIRQKEPAINQTSITQKNSLGIERLFNNEGAEIIVTPHIGRKFSVVPVCDPNKSSQSNVDTVKKKIRYYSLNLTENKSEESESLLSLPSSQCLVDILPSTSNTGTETCERPIINVHLQSDNVAKKNEMSKCLLTPYYSLTPRSKLSSESIIENEIPSFFNRKDSLAATQFPRVELKLQETLPVHYMTVNGLSSSPFVNLTSSQYMTLQPTRSRGFPNKQVLASLHRNFVTNHCDGTSTIDYGSTDGKNIKLRARALFSQPESSVGGGSHTAGAEARISQNSSTSGCHLPVIKQMEMLGGAERGSADGTVTVQDRLTWSSKLQFLLACIGSCVAYGNFWRFPYQCYTSGGGAFLIPYFVMLFLCGFPLLLMEMTVGQYTRRGPVAALQMLCPVLIGSAVTVIIVSIIYCSCYNVIISWCIYYFIQSFKRELPWACSNIGSNSSGQEGVMFCDLSVSETLRQPYTEEDWLHRSSSTDDNVLVWPLLGCLLLAWILVYFTLYRSVRSSGVVVQFTATCPFLLTLVFLVCAVTLDGAGDGLRLLFYPEWKKLLDIKVWVNAATQNINSIGIGLGTMITYSSYNKFSNNLLVDVWVIGLTDAATSLVATIIVFSSMGNIALELGKNITDLVAEGPALAFVVYPQALAKMPYPNVFCILFFGTFILLGIDSQFATVEVIVTAFQDAFPNWIRRRLQRHEILVLLVCLGCFLLGLPNILQDGIYLFTMLDYYTPSMSLMYLALLEVVAVLWCYGGSRLARNLRHMTGRSPSMYFRVCWSLSAPILILGIVIVFWTGYLDTSHNTDVSPYPTWAVVLSWTLTCFFALPVPVAAAVITYKAKGDTLWQKVVNASQSTLLECSKCKRREQPPASPCNCKHDVLAALSSRTKIRRDAGEKDCAGCYREEHHALVAPGGNVKSTKLLFSSTVGNYAKSRGANVDEVNRVYSGKDQITGVNLRYAFYDHESRFHDGGQSQNSTVETICEKNAN